MGTEVPYNITKKAFLKYETIRIAHSQLFQNQHLTILLSETDGNKTILPIASYELTKCLYLQQNHASFCCIISFTS